MYLRVGNSVLQLFFWGLSLMLCLSVCHGRSRDETVPFSSAEAAWFWFVQSQMARSEGAQIVAGAGLYPRPCEPVDIAREVERLYRGRRLLIDHIKVMKHYGVRMMSPDPRRAREIRAHHVWREAMERLEEALVRKAIVETGDAFGDKANVCE